MDPHCYESPATEQEGTKALALRTTERKREKGGLERRNESMIDEEHNLRERGREREGLRFLESRTHGEDEVGTGS